ncbi:cadherin domain-containing protein [Limimaricola cinnabarinus]|uniref:cadherin domain-containing protein n=1 Tax=Limimaricola cinnabarinus TaxID=1125964 RepID=UPI002FE263EE
MVETLVISGKAGAQGNELYIVRPDGTGIELLKDINPNGDSLPGLGATLNGQLYFGASSGTPATGAEDGSGREVWVTDGTEVGTRRVDDIVFGPGSSNPDNFVAAGNRMFFMTQETPGSKDKKLYVTDGTEPGTEFVKDIVYDPNAEDNNAIAFDGKLLFEGSDGQGGNKLWVTDGTELNTRLLEEFGDDVFLYPGAQIGEKMVFTAITDAIGDELWITDGSAAGTILLKDIYEGVDPNNPNNPNSSVPDYLTLLNGRVYFAAQDSRGDELWSTDGTREGTQIVKNINPATVSSVPTDLTVIGNNLIFAAYDNITGDEPWVSDGTPSGTRMLADLFPGTALPNTPNSSSPRDFTPFSDGTRAVFAATDGNGEELWVTDGTQANTFMLKDIWEEAQGSNINDLTAVGDLVYFTADGFEDGKATGNELWVTDGTKTGTKLVEELVEGAGSSEIGIVGVIDVNTAPDDIGISSASVAENSTAGTVVGTLSANDAENDEISFSLSDSSDGRFAISGNTLVVAGPIDFETTPRLSVEVVATDAKGANNSRTIEIEVGDVDDANKPPKDLALSDRSIDENRPAGSLVGTLSATDPDGDPLSFELIDDGNGLFELDGSRLVTTKALDFEDRDSHSVNVKVSDPDGASQDKTFIIEVGDVSDPTPGDDELEGTPGDDVIDGLAGDDRIFGRGGDDELIGSAGRDRIFGNGGDDEIFGNGGNDRLRGGTGEDMLRGGGGRDDLKGNRGDDEIEGNGGRDTIRGGGGEDDITGGNGRDNIDGDNGADSIEGNNGRDTIDGGNGDDAIDGGNGRDTIDGGNGDDEIDGGKGRDFMTGGSGDDSFVINDKLKGDRITDMDADDDTIDLSAHGIDFDDIEVKSRGDNTVLKIDDVGRLVLENFAADQVSENMFDF